MPPSARAVVVAIALTATLARADAGPIHPDARARLERGLALFEQQRYDEALAALEQGYAIDPRPEFLYARAQAERLAGRCARAIALYEAFLATAPTPEREAAARANLARCKDTLAATPPAPSAMPSATPPPEPAPAASAAPTSSSAPGRAAPPPRPRRPVRTRRVHASPWFHDVTGDLLLGGGVVGIGLGGYYFFSSRSAVREAERAGEAPVAGTYDDHRSRLETAGKQRTLSVVAGSLGVILIGSALLRYQLRAPGSATRTGVALGAGYAGVSVERSF